MPQLIGKNSAGAVDVVQLSVSAPIQRERPVLSMLTNRRRRVVGRFAAQ